MTEVEYYTSIKGEIEFRPFENPIVDPKTQGWCHNLRGFKSYRSMLPNENSTDSRLIKK